MNWAQTVLIVWSILFASWLHIDQSRCDRANISNYLQRFDKSLVAIASKLNSIDSESKQHGNFQLTANDYLSSIKAETTKTRIYLDSIEFKMRQKDHDEDVKTQFANGKIGRK